jgi:DNA-binding transcriptional regulator YiaG
MKNQAIEAATGLEPFHVRLRAARAGSQRLAAERIGCPLRTFEEWESGRRVPKAWAQKWILKALAGGSAGKNGKR